MARFKDFDPAIAADFVAQFEGCRLTAYRCPAGVWTIGYGHTKDVHEGDQIDKATALELLTEDLVEHASQAAPLVTADIDESQFVALLDFVFNVGVGNFRRSSVLKNLNKGATLAAANAFLLWNKAGGKTLPGLTRRRRAEQRLFLRKVP